MTETVSKEELDKFIKENIPQEVRPATQQVAPQHKKICLAILSHNCMTYNRVWLAMLQAVMQCAQLGWGFCYILREGDSMVARGRNILASQFLEHPDCQDCTDLVFVDTDVTWEGDQFVRLCSHPVDVVGAAYPYKNEEGKFPLRWSVEGIVEDTATGLWYVEATTPGFFRVTRRALEKMAKCMPYLQFAENDVPQGQRAWMFFDNIQRSNGVYDEGYVFCERARQVGFQTFLDPDIELTHIGIKAYNHGTARKWIQNIEKTGEQLLHDFPHVPPLLLAKKAMGENVELPPPPDEEAMPAEVAA